MTLPLLRCLLTLASFCFGVGAYALETPLVIPPDDPGADPSHRIVWGTDPGIWYELQQSADLERWTTVAGFPIEAQGATLQHAFMAEGDRLFFRVRRLDLPSPPEGFALIPPGSFEMGDHFGDGFAEEGPVHTVYLSGFYMGLTEVTKAQWDAVRSWAVDNGYTDLPAGGGKGPEHPVHSVNWFDAVRWLNAWSEREGLTPVYQVNGAVMKTRTGTPTIDYSADGYRLPTEAEWEKAARGGLSEQRFPWGNSISHDEANYRAYGSLYSYDASPYSDRTYHPDYNDGTMPYTSPVGSFTPNGYGLSDMAGNISEWCNDWYSGTYYSSSPDVDPQGPSSGRYRIIRGGGWSSEAVRVQASSRNIINPFDEYHALGFRPARTLSP